MSADKPFTKENLDNYLKELAKEFRKLNGNKMPAEIILIGGASVLINYGFREMTYGCNYQFLRCYEGCNQYGWRQIGTPIRLVKY